MKYIAQYETTVQVSQDDFKVVRNTLEVTQETTVGEIVKWLARKNLTIKSTNTSMIEIRQIDES